MAFDRTGSDKSLRREDISAQPSPTTPFEHEFNDEDPSVANGGQIVFDRELCVELRRITAPDQAGITGNIVARVICLEDGGRPVETRLELSSEADLFFHYTARIDEATFDRVMRREQRLMCEFGDFPRIVEQALSQCIREPETYMAVMFVGSNGQARLEFIQNMAFKYVELLTLPLMSTDEEVVRQQISYRYNKMKMRMLTLQDHLQQVKTKIKLKNPSLYQHMERQGRQERRRDFR